MNQVTRSWRCSPHAFERAKRALAQSAMVVIDGGAAGVLRPPVPGPEGTGRFTYDGELLTLTVSFQDPLASDVWRLLDDLCGPPVGLG